MSDGGTLEQQVATLREEVEVLRVAAKQHFLRPWYRDGAVTVAAMAFVFSLGTTAVTYFKGEQQLREGDRRELRDLSLKLGTIPRELFEFQQKYGNNQQALSSFGGLLNTEQQILAKQASEIIWRIPDLVSASEHLYVANALINANLPHLAEWHLQSSVTKAKDADELIAAYRILGNVAYMRGDAKAGRENYQQAKTVLESGRVPIMNTVYVTWSNVLTDIRWAQAEAMLPNCVEFERRLKSASEGLNGLSELAAAGPRAEIRQLMAQGCPPRAPGQPAAAPPITQTGTAPR